MSTEQDKLKKLLLQSIEEQHGECNDESTGIVIGSDVYYDNLPEGIDRKTADNVTSYNYQYIAATGHATAEYVSDHMSSVGPGESFSMAYDMGNNQLAEHMLTTIETDNGMELEIVSSYEIDLSETVVNDMHDLVRAMVLDDD